MIRRRRRRNKNEIAFGLDSFLDIIANVIGIIIRMILVVWVGASTYYAAQYQASRPQKAASKLRKVVASTKAPPPLDLEKEKEKIEAAKRRLRQRLTALPDTEAKQKQAIEKVKSLRAERSRMLAASKMLAEKLGEFRNFDHLTKNALTDILTKQELLKTKIAKLQQLPTRTKKLYYRAPVSREVRNRREVFFECRGGRVTFIDVHGFLNEVEANLLTTLAERLEKQNAVTYTTRAIGAFRMQWAAERMGFSLDGSKVHVRWMIEPVQNQRGETSEQALGKNSRFRNVVDFEDPRTAVVTFCVYPDSFGVYRKLRDYLYRRKMEVAGRPLPFGTKIGASSRNGRPARGQ